jgi:hypothetical protein
LLIERQVDSTVIERDTTAAPAPNTARVVGVKFLTMVAAVDCA